MAAIDAVRRSPRGVTPRIARRFARLTGNPDRIL